MEINYKDKIFDYIKNNEDDLLLDILKKSDKSLNLDIMNKNNIYLIQYLVNLNKFKLLEYILNNFDIRIDILDIDGRIILYYPIKFNYTKIFDLILEYNKKIIGLTIMDIRDKLGYTSLHYCIIINNFNFFKKLYNYGSDITIVDNNKNNIFDLCLKYKRNDMLLYLIENEFNKDIYSFINIRGESIFYQALVYDNYNITDFLINIKKYIQNIMNSQENQYGLTILHQMVITNNNKYIDKLLEYGIDYNKSDYYGNTPHHYAILENNYDYINKILNKDNIKINYNTTNINGETLLHLYLMNNDYSDIMNNNYNHYDNIIILIKNTDLNLQNNDGITPLHLIIELGLWKDDNIKKILESGDKDLNLFISDNKNNNSIKRLNNNNEFIDIVVISYYNKLKNLKNNLDELVIDWEKYCASDDLNNLLKSINKKKGKSIDLYCTEMIRKMIVEEKRSVPQYVEINFNFDEDIVMEDNCFYTGSTIDILFGLIYLSRHNNVNFIISYPLSDNKKLTDYYKKIGLNYSYKVEFINIEIVWSFQKLILMTNFESIIQDKLSKSERFIVIPLGIEISDGSHANIIIIDKKKKIIERFEPNGQSSPRNFNYNPKLLDLLLENNFNNIDSLTDYNYIPPNKYLPIVGFQMLESINDDKCKFIGDPNGFCAVWCVWYIHFKLINPDIDSKKLVKDLIKKIKLSNKSFKSIIRNFSKKIAALRDNTLKKYNITINDWMNNNYDKEIIDNIEKDVLDIF
jgi:ankyrin repeat protein